MLPTIIRQSGNFANQHLLFAGENSNNPVLEKSGTGNEAKEIRNPCIVEYDTNTWVQFYIARSNTRREGIKYATSPKSDPHNWTKQGSLIVSSRPAFWDDEISGVAAIKEGGIWYLFYSSWDDGKIGLATGSSLTGLSRYSSDPIIDNTATSNFDKYLRHPCIVKYAGVFYLFMEARADAATAVGYKNSNITYYTSSDLINWTRHGSPLFDNSAWNTYYYTMNMPTVKFFDGKFHMFLIGTYVFGGISRTGPGIIYAVAESIDNWRVVSHNVWAIPKRGAENQWNSGNNQEPELFITDDNQVFLYVNGRSVIDGNSSNGYYILGQGNFQDTLPGGIENQNFNGNTTPDGWTFTEQNGVTISQDNGLIISADGSQDSATFSVIEFDTAVSNLAQTAYSFALRFNVYPFNSTAEVSFELSNSDRSTGLFFKRNNTGGTIDVLLKISGVDEISSSQEISNGTMVKASKDGNQAGFYEENDGLFNLLTSGGEFQLGETDLKFKVVIQNKLGEATTVVLPGVSILPFDHPKVSQYL